MLFTYPAISTFEPDEQFSHILYEQCDIGVHPNLLHVNYQKIAIQLQLVILHTLVLGP